ncbi:unnamed protein product [Arabidopsis thaliana]|uniref:(thale cress) hypothetical protein n=1 Tax=Arabidopsis thaliana TaxID=3702 RepID=A0A7G2F478_ARATH|nr:unnamed protein product [Arabidopsis thaliana]
MNSIVGEVQEAQYIFPHSFTTNNDPSYDDLIEMKPPKILETTYISPSSHLPPNSKPHHIHHHSSSRILSFEDYGSNDMEHEYSPTYLNSIFSQQVEAQVPPHQKCEEFNRKGTKRPQPFSRNQSNAQDHIIAERKHGQGFCVGRCIKAYKVSPRRVRELEEQKKERRLESMVLVKKSKLILDDNNQSFSSSGEDGFSDLDLPEIEVRFSDEDVLIKILCEKQKGHLAKIMAEIEKLHILITNSSVLNFGPTLDITIIAKKESDFDMTLMDVVKSLRSALSNFI